MAYKIKNTDGSTLLLLGDGKIDSESVSITLVGKNYSTYGEIWNNNLIQLMGNFANTTEPSSPIKGQLWYDSFNQKLNVYDEEWEPINGSRVETSEPAALSVGDFWFDSVNNQLYIKAESGTKLVGPPYSSSVGSNGWVLPPNSIQDNTNGTSGNVKQVTLLRNYGTTLGYVANETFTIATTSTNNYITTATTSTVKGLTVLGNIRATEIVYANTITVTSSIVYPASERIARTVDIDFYVQIDNLAFSMTTPGGSSWFPKMKTASGTEKVVFSGFYTKMSGASVQKISAEYISSSLTTSAVNILTTGDDFDNIGDMVQIILTKQTTTISTYRITMQLVSDGSKASIIIEKMI